MLTKNLSTQTLGAWGEHYAARLYIKQGYKLLARNSFNRTGKQMGEIDLIMLGRNQIIFVEVKTRVSSRYGLPEEAISAFKQKRIIKIVRWFLARHLEYQIFQPRIDVCAILIAETAKIVPSTNLDKFVKYAKIVTNAVELN